MSKDDEAYFNFLNILEPHFGMRTTLENALRDVTTEDITADLLMQRDNKSADGKTYTGIRFYLFNDEGVMLERQLMLERFFSLFALPEIIALRLERMPEGKRLECTHIIAVGNKKIIDYQMPHDKNMLDITRELALRGRDRANEHQEMRHA